MPIWFTLIRIELATSSLDSFAQKFDVGHEKIVADQLNLVAEPRRQFLPAVPIVFRAAVLDRDDRETARKVRIIIDQFRRPIASSRRIS